MIHDIVVVGAGVSGLALARQLRLQGRSPVVLERSRGVGGRCATRRIDGQAVDHGVAYLHGSSDAFLAELDRAGEVTVLPDWPRVREGDGTPCQPEAFDGRDRRLAFGEGVSRFAKHLARGLDVRLGAEVTVLQPVDLGTMPGRGWSVTLTTGDTLHANALALTMPAPEVAALLRRAPPPPAAIAAILPLLELVRMLPCLTVIARYPPGAPAPTWEASFPRRSRSIHTILHDSSKRAPGARLVLVIQARPGFSRAHLDGPVEGWTRTLLQEAAALHGEWIAAPDLVQSHVWTRGRVDAGAELAGPIAIELDRGEVLGIAGDGLHHAGGIEGAYLSGIALAARFIEQQSRG